MRGAWEDEPTAIDWRAAAWLPPATRRRREARQRPVSPEDWLASNRTGWRPLGAIRRPTPIPAPESPAGGPEPVRLRRFAPSSTPDPQLDRLRRKADAVDRRVRDVAFRVGDRRRALRDLAEGERPRR
jgi:hypothetical protein